jgi:hypothetical protein
MFTLSCCCFNASVDDQILSHDGFAKFSGPFIVQTPRQVAVCKSLTMPYDLGVARKPVSSSCFRLLSLMPEAPSDVEVMKPVLEELEVMRLCCSLGMLPSLNPKDFKKKPTQTRELDDAFVLFLRKEIFGADEKTESTGVKAIALFGKQDGVKKELEKTNCWSESDLKGEDQGIYCVTRKTDAGERSLVLFGWPQDRWFRKSRLRRTATYMLRFLTCLSSNVVCCLSPEDARQLERCVESMDSTERAVRGSFSVAFHVERQEVKEAVTCESLPHLKLPRTVASQHVQLLKGSYPAFFAVEVVPEVKWVDQSHRSFGGVKAFAEWVVAEFKQRNLRLELDASGPERYRDALLEASGRWPHTELKDVQGKVFRSIQRTVQRAKARVQQHLEDHRANLLQVMDDLFDVDVLHKAAKDEGAFVTLHTFRA